jgi:hypothetical protein
MKYTDEIEILLKEFHFVNVQIQINSKYSIERENSNQKSVNSYMVICGIIAFFLAANYTDWPILLSVTVASFIAPIGFLFQMGVRWASEKGKNSNFQTTSELESEIQSLFEQNNIIESKLNDRILGHIERVEKLIVDRHKYKPTRNRNKITTLKIHYIHSQYLQINEAIKILEETYGIFWKRKDRSSYIKVINRFNSLRGYYSIAFFSKIKWIDIK